MSADSFEEAIATLQRQKRELAAAETQLRKQKIAVAECKAAIGIQERAVVAYWKAAGMSAMIFHCVEDLLISR